MTAALALVLAGTCACGDRGGSADRPAPATSSAEPSGPSGAQEGWDEVRGAATDLTGFDCSYGKRWRASGKVENSTEAAAEYVVTVTLVRPETSEVIGRQARTFVLEPGRSKPFDVAFRDLDVRRPGALKCVPRVVRGVRATD